MPSSTRSTKPKPTRYPTTIEVEKEEKQRRRKPRVVSVEGSITVREDAPELEADPVAARLKSKSPEQLLVVGPLAQHLLSVGWYLTQMTFGKMEWRVPKSPSEATKRERGESFDGFPCDITIFDSPKRTGDPKHVVVIIECKQPDEETGVSQLEQLMANEPHVKFGAWCNSADPSARAVFVYREPSGRLIRKRKLVSDLPHPGDRISSKAVRVEFNDLALPSEETLRRTISHLLDRVVANDANVTRREEQLDQLCNLFLLKLESDKRAKADASVPMFRSLSTASKTGEETRRQFSRFVDLYREVFTEERDRQLHFTDDTLQFVTESLAVIG